MKLSEAIEVYTARRRAEGSPFVSSGIILGSFHRFCGDIEVQEVTARRIEQFTNTPKCAAATRSSKFSAVKCFVEHCSARGIIESLVLQKHATPQITRVPYIYTSAQLRVLLNTARMLNCKKSSLDGETLRMVLLMLYATGTSIHGVLGLRLRDLNLENGHIKVLALSEHQFSLPIGTELRHELLRYVRRKRGIGEPTDLLFSCKDRRPIKRANLWTNFVKLHALARASKTAAGHKPRLQDLKYTFAVHRLSSCIKRREKLNDLIPALSSYLGYRSLTKSEQFLAYVPERFAEDLGKLSPESSSKPWRDIPELWSFLEPL